MFFYLLSLLSCFVAIQAAGVSPVDAMKQKVMALSKSCAEEHKLPLDQTTILTSKDIPQTDAQKCYLSCVFEKAGIVKDGEIDLEGSKKLAASRYTDEQKVQEVIKGIEACKSEIVSKPEEKCYMGGAIRECRLKHGSSVAFF